MFANYVAFIDKTSLSKTKSRIVSDLFCSNGGKLVEEIDKDYSIVLLTNKYPSNRININEARKFYSVDWISDSINKGELQDIEQYQLTKKSIKLNNISKKRLSKKLKSDTLVHSLFPSLGVYECQRKCPIKNYPFQDFVDQLLLLARARYFSNDLGNAQAYERAASILKSLPRELTLDEAKMLKYGQATLYGIGSKIAGLIFYYLSENKTQGMDVKKFTLPEVENLRQDPRFNTLCQFLKIYGVGPKTAVTWYDKEHINSIKRLKERAFGFFVADEVNPKHLKLPSMHLQKSQFLSLTYFDDLIKGITREECHQIANWIQNLFSNAAPEQFYLIQIVGGYRRGKQINGDLDLMLTHEHKKRITSNIISTEHPFDLIIRLLKHEKTKRQSSAFIATLSMSHKKKTGDDHIDRCTLLIKNIHSKSHHVRQVDLVYVPFSHMEPFVLLSWTGSAQFERSLRIYAQRELDHQFTGWSLIDKRNDKQKVLNLTSEQDIFQYLGLEYIEPEYRNC